MTGRGSVARAAGLLCAAATLPLASSAYSQTSPPQQPSEPAELDPSAPLDPMPDLGVAWPDLRAKDTTKPSSSPAAQSAQQGTTESASQVHYTWAIEGLASIGDTEELLTAFRKQSALEADRKDPANAAQLGRRSRADADPLS